MRVVWVWMGKRTWRTCPWLYIGSSLLIRRFPYLRYDKRFLSAQSFSWAVILQDLGMGSINYLCIPTFVKNTKYIWKMMPKCNSYICTVSLVIASNLMPHAFEFGVLWCLESFDSISSVRKTVYFFYGRHGSLGILLLGMQHSVFFKCKYLRDSIKKLIYMLVSPLSCLDCKFFCSRKSIHVLSSSFYFSITF